MIITGACGCDRLPPSLGDALRTASLLIACLWKALRKRLPDTSERE